MSQADGAARLADALDRAPGRAAGRELGPARPVGLVRDAGQGLQASERASAGGAAWGVDGATARAALGTALVPGLVLGLALAVGGLVAVRARRRGRGASRGGTGARSAARAAAADTAFDAAFDTLARRHGLTRAERDAAAGLAARLGVGRSALLLHAARLVPAGMPAPADAATRGVLRKLGVAPGLSAAVVVEAKPGAAGAGTRARHGAGRRGGKDGGKDSGTGGVGKVADVLRVAAARPAASAENVERVLGQLRVLRERPDVKRLLEQMQAK